MRSRLAAGPDSLIEHIPHWGVLVILLVFTYARLHAIPYKGFDLSARGQVLAVYVDGSPGNPLQVGDRLIQAGDLTWVDFRADFGAVLFGGLDPGQIVPIIVERDGVQRSIQWTYPGLNSLELIRYTWSAVWLSYFFWIVGMMTAIHLRPRGESRTMAVAYSYLAALWIMFGGDASFSHIWGSAYLYTFVFFIGVPLTLHFHWIWPRPLAKLPASVVWVGYAVALLTAAGIVLGLVPRAVFSGAFLVVLTGIPVLLALHGILQPELRPFLRRFLLLGTLSVLPLGSYPILRQYVGPGIAEGLAAIGMPLMPLVYMVTIRRRELAPLELRVNRAVTAYVFLVLLALLVVPFMALAAFRLTGPGTVMAVGSMAAVVGAAMGWLGYPRLQAFFDRHVLGLPLPENELVRSYVSRIAVAPSIPRIVALLNEEVLPSLLVRQFLFLRLDEPQPRVLLALGVSESMMPSPAGIPSLLQHEAMSGSTGDPPPLSAALGWVRIVMAVKVENDVVGLWLLGRRDPDDHYRDQDVALIRSLSDQTAIALGNIIQTERVRALYQANVRRNEEERLQLAHALHDRVLNQLAALLMRLDDPSITPAVLKSFEEFSNRVREIVADLRPPMLAYGLRPALAELVESLAERPPHEVSISIDLPEGETRYPPEVELHLFRITQESCTNALHHAGATRITVCGRLDPDDAQIEIEDDGAGFEVPGTEALGRLIAQKHFGLAGMIERANLIGGSVQIQTAPGKGTRIKAVWKAGSSGALSNIPE